MDPCARMNCENDAVALLSFAPRQAKAWLSDLTEPNPATGIALCRRHANATVVPMSWQLVDARDPGWTPPNERRVFSEAVDPTADALPSDADRLEREFAGIEPAFPVETTVDDMTVDASRTTVESFDASLPGTPIGVDPLAEATGDPDPSLFELPIGDLPAVTPHPGWR